MSKPTPKETLLRQLSRQERTTITDFASFGRIKNWNDFKRATGITAPETLLQRELSVDAIREAFGILKQQIEKGQDENKLAANTNSNHDLSIKQSSRTPTEPSTQSGESSITDSKTKHINDEFSIIPSLRHNPKVQYNHQQELAAAWIVRGFMSCGYPAIGFPWPVGTGKTYVFSAVLAELYRREFRPLMESVALYPACVVTRASIVEQTKRVLSDEFGLVIGKQVDVTNIDQLRSKFGENFLKEEIEIRDGIEHVVYKWIEPLSPAIIILDESQSVKNVDSAQSQIMQAYNELNGEDHRILFSSATMFTRVVESKCFAVSTRLEW